MSATRDVLEREAQERDAQFVLESYTIEELRMAAKKAAATRPYQVTHRETGVSRFVEAGNPAQALRHVAKDVFEVRVPSALELARHAAAGNFALEQVGDVAEGA